MRYIKQILTQKGYVPTRIANYWAYKMDFSVMVHDTERNSDSICTIYKLDDGVELGYACFKSYRGVVRMDERFLRLHQFVTVETVDANPYVSFDFKNEDYLYRDGFKHKETPAEEKRLVVAYEDVEIDIGGAQGSVCSVRSGRPTNAKVMSLFELLMGVCKAAQTNIFMYKEILIGHRDGDKCVRIVLHKDAEANRFFLKMAMEVLGAKK